MTEDDEEKQLAALKRYQAMNSEQMKAWRLQLKAWLKDPKNFPMPDDAIYLVSFDTPLVDALKDKIKDAVKDWRSDPTYVLTQPLDKGLTIPGELRRALLALVLGDITEATKSMSYLLRNYSEQLIRGAIFDAFPAQSWNQQGPGPAIGPVEETPVPEGSSAQSEEDVVPLKKEKE